MAMSMIQTPNGESIPESQMRYLYDFTHMGTTKEFGPYESEHEAGEAFQRVYGYWPEDAVSVRPYWGAAFL